MFGLHFLGQTAFVQTHRCQMVLLWQFLAHQMVLLESGYMIHFKIRCRFESQNDWKWRHFSKLQLNAFSKKIFSENQKWPQKYKNVFSKQCFYQFFKACIFPQNYQTSKIYISVKFCPRKKIKKVLKSQLQILFIKKIEKKIWAKIFFSKFWKKNFFAQNIFFNFFIKRICNCDFRTFFIFFLRRNLTEIWFF